MFKPKEKIHTLSVNELENYFSSLFNQLSIRHGHHYVFDHLLDCAINGFCFNYSQNIMEHIRKVYSQDERYIFGELIKIWILLADKRITDNSQFYDFFGNFYEKQSMSKQKGFAQYFTPEPICKLMAQIVIDKDKETVCEPACGSGRLNLAIHAINYQCFHYANDLDYTCVKMATLNFMLHGIKGILTCDDGLFPKTKFRGAFIVNDRSAPSIVYLDNADQAYNFAANKIGQTDNKLAVEEVLPVQNEVYPNDNNSDVGSTGQLSLF